MKKTLKKNGITPLGKKMVDYLLEGIDFSDITVLDAATGAGNTTLKLARRMAEAGGKGKIISVDIDPETFQVVKQKLGELARFVEFVEADLTCMPQIESESFDLVVCTATLCALNDKPLKALRGLTEFYRVLKKGGRLIISEEYPLPKATKPEEEVQVMRWQMYKSVAELVDAEHWTEIHPEELEFAASLAGFKDIEWRRFEGGPLRKVTMDEWKEVMPPLVNKIEDEETREAFLSLITKIYKKFEEQGGSSPPGYIMKMIK
ncbi:MAG: class I SAM-dependent methyltransferase [Candidatus Bathyarchaeia archaeon]